MQCRINLELMFCAIAVMVAHLVVERHIHFETSPSMCHKPTLVSAVRVRRDVLHAVAKSFHIDASVMTMACLIHAEVVFAPLSVNLRRRRLCVSTVHRSTHHLYMWGLCGSFAPARRPME